MKASEAKVVDRRKSMKFDLETWKGMSVSATSLASSTSNVFSPWPYTSPHFRLAHALELEFDRSSFT
jgi:hypothetical protein